jgi:hypothetical protein
VRTLCGCLTGDLGLDVESSLKLTATTRGSAVAARILAVESLEDAGNDPSGLDGVGTAAHIGEDVSSRRHGGGMGVAQRNERAEKHKGSRLLNGPPH